MPGSKTPKPPACQIHSWPGCQRRTSSFHSMKSERMRRPARRRRASSTAGLYCECQVAKMTRFLSGRVLLEVLELRDRRRRRLFEQHVLACCQGFTRDRVADRGRRADRDGVEIRHGREELRRRSEARHAVLRDAALAHDGGETEAWVLGDDRQVLVLRDLAEPDDRDAVWRHGRFPHS